MLSSSCIRFRVRTPHHHLDNSLWATAVHRQFLWLTRSQVLEELTCEWIWKTFLQDDCQVSLQRSLKKVYHTRDPLCPAKVSAEISVPRNHICLSLCPLPKFMVLKPPLKFGQQTTNPKHSTKKAVHSSPSTTSLVPRSSVQHVPEQSVQSSVPHTLWLGLTKSPCYLTRYCKSSGSQRICLFPRSLSLLCWGWDSQNYLWYLTFCHYQQILKDGWLLIDSKTRRDHSDHRVWPLL